MCAWMSKPIQLSLCIFWCHCHLVRIITVYLNIVPLFPPSRCVRSDTVSQNVTVNICPFCCGLGMGNSTSVHLVWLPRHQWYRRYKIHKDTMKFCTFTVALTSPQWDAADAEIKVPSGENIELKRSPLKALSRSVHSNTCYAYCQGFLPCLFLHFRSIHLHFFQTSPNFSCVGCGQHMVI